ncbi:MAG: uracil-DNA glycosylase [Caldisericaceae bacterium]
MEKKILMNEISESINECRACPLYETRKEAVPGEGSLDADIMFVGEGPGAEEDRTGRPFVGAAGKLLDKLLATIGLKRQDVYIGNIVKCRPPNNRVPSPREVEACLPYLYGQIAIIEPIVIVTLGNTPLNTLVSPELKIGAIHGKMIVKDDFDFFPMYHPAAALYHNDLLSILESDFLKLGEVVAEFKSNVSLNNSIGNNPVRDTSFYKGLKTS